MITSSQIRQSFLDFFREKQHTIVPSASLFPDSPNLLFTNAGMNQFVPIFLGQRTAPYQPPRVADAQKCIRAGGKHNDLDDVGIDTYHHTFFEMLGNWSFGDYFKKEAIEWAWELVVERWGLPPQRLYATVYKPGAGEPSEFDREAHEHWAQLFLKAGLDPAVHIVNGSNTDNFWMMGDTGPCGPCSELHVDLTPAGDTGGTLLNAGDPRCIEIWNLVFIQFNANADGTFSPLPQRHVDTGMGFERVTAMIQGTKDFTDFSRPISNYETDIFRPIFDEIEKLSGKHYSSTLPDSGDWGARAPSPAAGGASPAISANFATVQTGAARGAQHGDRDGRAPQIETDVAFRVIADHIRTLSFAIADGIQPSNEGRGYVLRRILRRAVRYGRTLGFHEPFFYKLVDTLVRSMSDVFPELWKRQEIIKDTLRREEESFNKTLDKGIALFEGEVRALGSTGGPPVVSGGSPETIDNVRYSKRGLPHFERGWAKYAITFSTAGHCTLSPAARQIVFDSILHWNTRRYTLYAACVMPDHVHFLIEPQIKASGQDGSPLFFSLAEILHTIKSFTAHEINKTEQRSGLVWGEESFDRLIRSERDLQEKFDYITRNPWDTGVTAAAEEYRWVWWPGLESARGPRAGSGGPSEVDQEAIWRAAESSTPAARGPRNSAASAPQISGAFAFRLYDEQGFPLDLTELMARERGLTVDVAGFDELMEQQRERARAAQKKQKISVLELDGNISTEFVGFEELNAVAEILQVKQSAIDATIVPSRSPLYAAMGGQVADTGWMTLRGKRYPVADVQKQGARQVVRLTTPLDLVNFEEAIGEEVTLEVQLLRRHAIERHHTATHLLHWALHEVVSRDAAQKGSYVGAEKLTFDFSSAALTQQQVREVERLVNERIRENANVSWTEIPYAEAKKRADIQQFFGEKYGDLVRVVQIGGEPGALNGYSMELCGGTHVRGTGEIGWFKIVRESAIAAGIRRIEAVAGDAVLTWAAQEAERQEGRFQMLSGKKSGIAAPPDFAKNESVPAAVQSIETRASHLQQLESEVHEWEKQHAKAAELELRSRAAKIANELAAGPPGKESCIAEVPDADGALLQAIADTLKARISVPIFLAGTSNGRVDLIAVVPKALTTTIRANDLIQQVAPIVGGKGGGRPDSARGSGKNASRIGEALAHARALIEARTDDTSGGKQQRDESGRSNREDQDH